jgi:Bifunctional DNA primase/polymerase, N-terminal
LEGYNLQPDGTTPPFIHLDEINTKSILEAAIDYQGRGLTVTPLHGKRPVLRRWQERYLSESELPRYFVDGRNVGVVLGGATGLVDVDLDNPVAVDVADLLLPDTVKSGRMKNPRSHHWLVCDPAPPSRRYVLTNPMADRLMIESREATLVELRCTGHQTVVAPSIHPVDGDRYLWHPGEICEIDGEVLAGFVLDVAVAALLALNRPLGSREWFLIHAFGFLCPRFGADRAGRIVEAASKAFDDEEHDERMLAVRSFLRKPVDDDAPMMEDLLAAELERLAPGVPALIDRWCARDRREGGGAR